VAQRMEAEHGEESAWHHGEREVDHRRVHRQVDEIGGELNSPLDVIDGVGWLVRARVWCIASVSSCSPPARLTFVPPASVEGTKTTSTRNVS
jgi:hypothetical protein